MRFWSRNRAEKADAGTALATRNGPQQFPPGSSTRDVSDLVRALTQYMGHYDMNAEGKILPRPEEWVGAQFGPGWPLPIESLDQPRPDTGMPEPRQFQYPVSWNLQLFDARDVSWETLRKASETPLFRACIEVRKTELASLDWGIRVSSKAAESIARKSRRSKEDVQNELRQKYEKQIEQATGFWEVPDRKNGLEFSDWVSAALEEQLTWDAIAVYPRRTYGGDLHDLMLIDASTIKPLMDEQGGRPEPPYPAWQQILYGFPRGEFTADTVDIDGKTVVPGGLTSTQLIYKRRVVRTRTPYGFSSTEQALLDGLLYNKRYGWMLAEYTEGTQPAQFMRNTGDVDWSARQLLQYEKAFNDRYSGRTAERYRFSILPPGIEPVTPQQIQERYKADYDLHLIARVAMHYGVMLPELGFTEKGGLGSAGYHEGQEAVGYRRFRLPDIRWFARFLTAISRAQLDFPPELEFAFLGLEEEDEAAVDEVVQNKTQSARMTLNEARARDGLPPYDFPEADMPMVQTARGVVFVEGASESAPPGVMIEPASELPKVPAGPGASGAPGQPVQPQPGQGQSPTQRRPISPAGRGKTAAAAAKELESFRSWVKKHPSAGRRFEFEDLTYEEAASLDPDLIDAHLDKAFFKAAGGGNPKASIPRSGMPGRQTSPWSPYTPEPWPAP
jgi:hypothetical protein